MIDKKYTDKDIISSLEVIATTCNCNECKLRSGKWGTCNCSETTANAALDLINHQKAEIDRLKECENILKAEKHSLIKTEAVKECLAKVKNYIKTHCNPYGKPDFEYDTSIKILNFIDNLVKEMADVCLPDDHPTEKGGER